MELDRSDDDQRSMSNKDIFRAMSVWHCLNCIQLNQADDESCIECDTPRGGYGLKTCGCAREFKPVSVSFANPPPSLYFLLLIMYVLRSLWRS
jgi:hypothetical protein